MEPFQQRVVQEQVDLKQKIEKLDNFLKTDSFLNLSNDDKFDLQDQLRHMIRYNRILEIRIEKFKVT